MDPKSLWPPLLAVYANGCEGSTAVVEQARALLRALGAPNVVDWLPEPFHRGKWRGLTPCNDTADVRLLGPRVRCLYYAAVSATYVFKVDTALFESRVARCGMLDAYRALAVPVLVFARQSALQCLACGVRDCFNRQTGGDALATLVDAKGRPLPFCRRFNRSDADIRGPADAARASLQQGARVRIVTRDPLHFCARLNAMRASKSVNARVVYLQRRNIDAAPMPRTFHQLLLDRNTARRAAAWRDWLAHGVPAVAAMNRGSAEATIAKTMPPPPKPLLRSVWDQYEDPKGVRALAAAGGCLSAAT